MFAAVRKPLGAGSLIFCSDFHNGWGSSSKPICSFLFHLPAQLFQPLQALARAIGAYTFQLAAWHQGSRGEMVRKTVRAALLPIDEYRAVQARRAGGGDKETGPTTETPGPAETPASKVAEGSTGDRMDPSKTGHPERAKRVEGRISDGKLRPSTPALRASAQGDRLGLSMAKVE